MDGGFTRCPCCRPWDGTQVFDGVTAGTGVRDDGSDQRAASPNHCLPDWTACRGSLRFTNARLRARVTSLRLPLDKTWIPAHSLRVPTRPNREPARAD